MKKTLILFLTLGLLALQSFSQEAFVLNKVYRQGWVVWYPSFGTFYVSKPISLTARKTPDLDPTNWNRYYYPTPTPAPVPEPTPTTTTELEKKLLLLLDGMDKRLKVMEKQWLIFGKGFDIQKTDTSTIINIKPL